MRTLAKIACRTVGTLGMGMALYNTSRICSHYAKVGSACSEQQYLEKVYFNSRTLNSMNYTDNALRKETFNLRSKSPIPAIWGKIKGGVSGVLKGLEDNLFTIIFSALALTCKNTVAKAGAIGVGLATCYTIAREGFGLGKNHPMS